MNVSTIHPSISQTIVEKGRKQTKNKRKERKSKLSVHSDVFAQVAALCTPRRTLCVLAS